ncbi:MAG: glycosyltransferase family 4 protein [Verrucomicrobiota bacterium]
MRILILNEAAAPVGGEMNHYVFGVAARLRASGDIVGLVHSREPKSEFRGTGYIFEHLRKMNASEVEVRTRLEAIVDDFKPDIVQIHGAPNLRLDPWLAARAPTVRWIHNHQFFCSGQQMTHAWPRKPCQRAHGPACLALHALCGCGAPDPVRNLVRYSRVSRSLALLRAHPGLQVASGMLKENLIRNGIEPSRIEHLPLYAPEPEEAKRPPLTSRRLILHPGGLVRHKGVWLLVRNIERLPDDVDILFAGGGGELQPALEEYVARQGLSERIRIMGEVSRLQWSQLFHQAALVVMPSLWNEPLGLAGVYAMAHGKAVVAFQNSGVNEWLENGRTGIAVEFGKRNAFIEAVASLLKDRERLHRFGIQAREAWDARFRPEHHLANLRAYYARVAGGGT